jgi:hypothetical protein
MLRQFDAPNAGVGRMGKLRLGMVIQDIFINGVTRVKVIQVQQGGLVCRQGIVKAGDLLLTLNSIPIKNCEHFNEILASSREGTGLMLTCQDSACALGQSSNCTIKNATFHESQQAEDENEKQMCAKMRTLVEADVCQNENPLPSLNCSPSMMSGKSTPSHISPVLSPLLDAGAEQDSDKKEDGRKQEYIAAVATLAAGTNAFAELESVSEMVQHELATGPSRGPFALGAIFAAPTTLTTCFRETASSGHDKKTNELAETIEVLLKSQASLEARPRGVGQKLGMVIQDIFINGVTRVKVIQVHEGGLVCRQGIVKAGDLLLTLNSIAIENCEHFNEILTSSGEGKGLVLTCQDSAFALLPQPPLPSQESGIHLTLSNGTIKNATIHECYQAEDGVDVAKTKNVEDQKEKMAKKKADDDIGSIAKLAETNALAETELPKEEEDDDTSAQIPSCGSVEEHVDTSLVLGVESKLEVGCLLAPQSIINHCPHRLPVLLGDELLHQITANHLLGFEGRDFDGLVALVDEQPLCIDGGCVGSVHEEPQLLCNTPLLPLGDISLGDVTGVEEKKRLRKCLVEASCAAPAGRVKKSLCWAPGCVSPKPSRMRLHKMARMKSDAALAHATFPNESGNTSTTAGRDARFSPAKRAQIFVPPQIPHSAQFIDENACNRNNVRHDGSGSGSYKNGGDVKAEICMKACSRPIFPVLTPNARLPSPAPGGEKSLGPLVTRAQIPQARLPSPAPSHEGAMKCFNLKLDFKAEVEAKMLQPQGWRPQALPGASVTQISQPLPPFSGTTWAAYM